MGTSDISKEWTTAIGSICFKGVQCLLSSWVIYLNTKALWSSETSGTSRHINIASYPVRLVCFTYSVIIYLIQHCTHFLNSLLDNNLRYSDFRVQTTMIIRVHSLKCSLVSHFSLQKCWKVSWMQIWFKKTIEGVFLMPAWTETVLFCMYNGLCW